MEEKKLKHLLQGLKNIRSKYYCEFSEKEHSIIDWTIEVIEKLMSSKKKWIKTLGKITKVIGSVILKTF